MRPLLFFKIVSICIVALTSLAASAQAAKPSTVSSELVAKALKLNLDQDQQWLNLLHFKKTMFGFFESQVDDKKFFYSPIGDKDPKAELVATLEAFLEPVDGKDERSIPQCRTPARLMWLHKKMPETLGLIPVTSCERFERYFNSLKGVSVSLVFSSYYINNPSSAFGHTFLRVNKQPAEDGRRYELLDYGLNYAAALGTQNALVYSVQGLFGLMPGIFTSVPYYYKVREYNNAESRDLWEYELKISPEAVNFMIAHIWELGPVSIDYWYLTENCSYHMLTLLEAADPSLKLTENTKKYIIPADTVKVVYETPGLVQKVTFRPSIRTEFETRLASLDSAERQQVIDLVERHKIPDELSSLNTERRAAVLDTAIDGVEYKHAVDVQKPESEIYKYKAQLLALRSQIEIRSPHLATQPGQFDQPHRSHDSRRASLGFLSRNKQESMNFFRYRYSLNDLLDPIGGYPEYAKIIFFDFSFSHGVDSQKLYLEELNLFEVNSMVPLSDFSKVPSWGLRVAVDRLQNENCLNCHAIVVSGGPGYSIEGSGGVQSKITSYLGINAEVDSTWRGPSPRWMFGIGPEARIRMRWNPHLISLLEGKSRVDFNTEQRTAQLVKFSTQWSYRLDQGIRFQVYDQWFDRGGGVEWVYYH